MYHLLLGWIFIPAVFTSPSSGLPGEERKELTSYHQQNGHKLLVRDFKDSTPSPHPSPLLSLNDKFSQLSDPFEPDIPRVGTFYPVDVNNVEPKLCLNPNADDPINSLTLNGQMASEPVQIEAVGEATPSTLKPYKSNIYRPKNHEENINFFINLFIRQMPSTDPFEQY